MALETQDFPVQSLGASLGLVVMSAEGAFAYPLPKQGRLTVGRDPSCEIRLHGFGVSRQHARLHVGATVQLVDLASRNGTVVGDRRLVPNEETEIHLGDAIRIGEVVLVLQPLRGGAGAPRATPDTGALPAAPLPVPAPSDVSGIVISREEERQRTIVALRACKGNQTKAAEMLGISRRTLVSRLNEFGLPRPRKQAAEPKT